MCGLTYSGHPLACAAGITTLDVYKEEKLVERSKAMGKILGQIEEELKRKHQPTATKTILLWHHH